MKKYAVIYRAVWIENLQYAAQIAAGYISYSIFIFVLIRLWSAMYAVPGERIYGYTKEQMIWYVMMTEMVWFAAGSATVTREVSEDIRGGNIAYLLNKPYHYTLYILAKYTGEWNVRLPMYAGFAVVLGVGMVGRLPGLRIQALVLALPCFCLGIMIHAVYKLCISLLSFWIEDSNPFQWLYDKAILIVGTLFPIEIFPAALQPVIKLTPIYTVCYGPAKVIVDFHMEKYLEILLAQAVYLAVGLGLMFLMYAKGAKKLYVNGG